MDEVREKLSKADKPLDKKKLRDMINDRVNVLNEFRDGTPEDLNQILILTRYLVDNLRFADGRSLKDVYEEQKLKKQLAEGEVADDYDDEYGSDEPDEREEAESEQSMPA